MECFQIYEEILCFFFLSALVLCDLFQGAGKIIVRSRCVEIYLELLICGINYAHVC